MASLGQSSLVAANMSCFVEDVCPSASGIRECRMSVSNGACSSSCSSSFWNSRSGYAADHSWQRSGRPATWRRKREGGGYNAPGQFSGVVRAGMDALSFSFHLSLCMSISLCFCLALNVSCHSVCLLTLQLYMVSFSLPLVYPVVIKFDSSEVLTVDFP